nr:S8 family serine peptidase [Lachnospiraceae bacterium]
MNSFKRKTALILTLGLILTSIPFSKSHVNAAILPDPTEIDAEQKEFVEGDVIVCMKTDDSAASYGNEVITNDRAGAVAGLLDEAEDLMDVTEAVKEEVSVDETGDLSNDKAAADEEYTLKFIHSDHYTTKQLIEMLEEDPDILFAEPNYIYQLTEEIEEDILVDDEEIDMIPAETSELPEDRDGSEAELHDLSNLQYAYGNNEGGIDVPYWNNTDYRNADDTVVAVLDTGVDYNHEDLKDVIWDDGLLYPELTALGGGRYGYNGVDSTSTGIPYYSYDPMDDQSHGTHCAGSVGAAWNGYGVSGTANGTRIMAVKAGNNKGSFPNKSTLKGFNYIKTAKEAGVNIVAVNNSWGGGVNSNSIALAVRELAEINVVCCFASGNDSADNDFIHFTSTVMRENDGVICVNSNDPEVQKSSFSNYGVRSTDLSSPGTEILSTIPTDMGTTDPNLCLPV